MNKKICTLIFLLFVLSSAKAQFSFHWAFPYYAYNNMEIKNGNKHILVLTKNANYNGFKEVEKKSWGKNNTFHYAQNLTEITLRSYKLICTDGTISSADLEKLHNEMPKNVLFFIHRNLAQWPADLKLLQKMLQERPGWAYGGNPYDPKTPIIRSNKNVFTLNQIILGNEAPGEGL